MELVRQRTERNCGAPRSAANASLRATISGTERYELQREAQDPVENDSLP